MLPAAVSASSRINGWKELSSIFGRRACEQESQVNMVIFTYTHTHTDATDSLKSDHRSRAWLSYFIHGAKRIRWWQEREGEGGIEKGSNDICSLANCNVCVYLLDQISPLKIILIARSEASSETGSAGEHKKTPLYNIKMVDHITVYKYMMRGRWVNERTVWA